MAPDVVNHSLKRKLSLAIRTCSVAMKDYCCANRVAEIHTYNTMKATRARGTTNIISAIIGINGNLAVP